MNNQEYLIQNQDGNRIIQEVKELRKTIQEFLYQFDVLADKYGLHKTYKALRKQYAEIISYDDFIINLLIDGLASSDNQFYNNFLESNKKKAGTIKKIVEILLIKLEELDRNKMDF